MAVINGTPDPDIPVGDTKGAAEDDQISDLAGNETISGLGGNDAPLRGFGA